MVKKDGKGPVRAVTGANKAYASPRKEQRAAPMEVAKAACSGVIKRMP